MRKFFIVAIACVLLFSQVASASVGYRKNRTFSGAVADIDYRNAYSEKTGTILTVYANGYADGTTGDGVTSHVSSDITNLTSATLAFGVVLFDDIGAQDFGGEGRWISLPDGTPGQVITFIVLADSGGVLYISDDHVNITSTKTGWDDLAFQDANDSVTLLFFDDTIGWIIIANNGVTIT